MTAECVDLKYNFNYLMTSECVDKEYNFNYLDDS